MPDDFTTAGTLDGASADDAGRAQAVGEITRQLEDDFKLRNELCQQMDDLVFMQNKVAIPPAYARNGVALTVHSPMATYIATSLAAALSINGQTVSFTPGR